MLYFTSGIIHRGQHDAPSGGKLTICFRLAVPSSDDIREFRAVIFGRARFITHSRTASNQLARDYETGGKGVVHAPVGHVVFFSRNDASAIIAIPSGTIPRNAFQSPVQRREKRSRPSEIARPNWFLRYTRPDQAIVVQIKKG